MSAAWPRRQPIPALPVEAWPHPERDSLLAVPPAPAANNPFTRLRQPLTAQVAEWSTAYRHNVRRAYGKWLGYLRHCAPEALALAPAARVDEARLTGYLEALIRSGAAASSRGAYLNDLLMALRVLAPEQDWGWLKDLSQALRAAASPARDKHARTLPAEALYRLGLDVIAEAEDQRTPLDRALRYRDGLIVALLAARPLRLRNVAALDLDRHLEIAENSIRLCFSAEEMKNRRACDWRLPDQLAPHLRRFVADHRPAFKGAQTHRGLWPSIRGKPLPSTRIASIFGQLTEQHLGVRLSPHCVRYAAATSAALASSACANTIPLLLGHADPRTAQAYYNLATTTQAQRLTTSTLQEIHAELRDKIGKRR